MKDPVRIELRLPAKTGLEVMAAETGASLAAWAGAPDGVVGDIRIALIEGCLNAIEHAYANRGGSQVVTLTFVVQTDVQPATLKIWIADTGAGFDLAGYREPHLEEKLHSKDKRGWGLKLMRGFMDDLQIVSGREGTTLEMTKYLSPVAEGA